MSTFITQHRRIVDLFAWSVDNCPDDDERLELLADRSRSRAYYRVPNAVPNFGSASVFRDHLDSMRHAATMIGAGELDFAIQFEDGTFAVLTPEMEDQIRD